MLPPNVPPTATRPGGGGWEKTSVNVMLASGFYPRDGYTHSAAPGLAVTPHAGAWGITHLSSGTLVTARGISTRPFSFDEAMTLALQLAAVGDWTRTSQQLHNDRPFRDAARALLIPFMEYAHA